METRFTFFNLGELTAFEELVAFVVLNLCYLPAEKGGPCLLDEKLAPAGHPILVRFQEVQSREGMRVKAIRLQVLNLVASHSISPQGPPMFMLYQQPTLRTDTIFFPLPQGIQPEDYFHLLRRRLTALFGMRRLCEIAIQTEGGKEGTKFTLKIIPLS